MIIKWLAPVEVASIANILILKVRMTSITGLYSAGLEGTRGSTKSRLCPVLVGSDHGQRRLAIASCHPLSSTQQRDGFAVAGLLGLLGINGRGQTLCNSVWEVLTCLGQNRSQIGSD
jgi:hypothetical protein